MKYISMDEYLMGRTTLDKLPDDLVRNANTIVPRANDLLSKFGEYRGVNSGYRTPEDQARINPGAPKSKHLTCEAVDLEDKDGRLKSFCKSNLGALASIGLWMEDPASTPTWVHIQCVPSKSGNRIFIP